jgi:hypothetical protein
MGAALALPLLDAMVPALSAGADSASTVVPRLGFIYAPNGTYLPNFFPKAAGTNFEFTPVLKPLEPLKNHIVVVSGLSNKGAENLTEGGGVHTRVGTAWLSGTRPKKTEGADIEAGTSIDQYAAAVIGKDTPLNSLQVALDYDFLVGSCENGYSCVYQRTFSWKNPTTPMPMEGNPRAVFERLFGEGGTAAARQAEMRRTRSILDSMADEVSRLERKLGTSDRRRVTEYLESVRAVERQIQVAESQAAARDVTLPDRPLDIPDGFEQHAQMMFDLTTLAYRADVTRVVSFLMGRELSQRTYPEIGVPEPHHSLSHHRGDAAKIAQVAKINAYHVQTLAGFLERLRSIEDGDGTLLDHSIVLYGGGIGDGNLHDHVELPALVAGGGAGLKGGRHVKYDTQTPMANLLLTLLDKAGVQIDRIGDSTGRLELEPLSL